MKKIFFTIYYLIGWILYYLFTLNDRNNYDHGMLRGMRVVDSKTDIFGTTYKLDPNEKPIRTFLTFKEFWSSRKHLTTN